MIIFTPNTVIKSTEVNSNFEESVNPVGIVIPYAGTTAPANWLFCFGQAVSRTTYSALFTALGTTYGTGDGSTTFNLPDMRGRVVAGKDDMGGTSANRLTGLSGGVNGDNLAATGGAESHTLTTTEMPSHTHGVYHNPVDNYSVNIVAGALAALDGPTYGFNQNSTATGGGGAHNNVQPTIILNYIIKT